MKPIGWIVYAIEVLLIIAVVDPLIHGVLANVIWFLAELLIFSFTIRFLLWNYKDNEPKLMKAEVYTVTGTVHGSLIMCESEGAARRIFHQVYNGESILSIQQRSKYALFV